MDFKSRDAGLCRSPLHPLRQRPAPRSCPEPAALEPRFPPRPRRPHRPPPTRSTAPSQDAPSPVSTYAAAPRPSCNCPIQEPAASPTRLPRSSAWSRTGWHGTRPSTAHGCPGRSLSPLPRPATDTLGRAKVLAPSPMSLDLCTADRRAPPTSATRTDTTGKHLLSRTAAPVPVTPGDSLPRKYTTGWGRLSNVNIPTSKMLRKFRSTSAILSPYSPPIRTAAENVR